MLDTPKDDLLNECLNAWPEGTVGYGRDQKLIKQLNDLCKEHGYGRIPQLAAAIEDIWRTPEKSNDHKKSRDTRMKLLTGG